jgi:hypothetical protein
MSISNSPSLKSFNYFLKKYGLSSSNLFDVQFNIPNNSELYLYLKDLGTFSPNKNSSYNPLNFLSFYTDEITLPGQHVSTGSYQFNSSPAYKYPTTVVYPEVTITLLLDSFQNQKKIIERWIDFQKPISSGTENYRLMRTRYKDDITADVTIAKYERYIYGSADTGIFKPKTVPYMYNEDNSVRAEAPLPIYRYSTVLKNAFPTTISSVQLSSGSAQLNRVSITFNYDYPIFSSTQKLDPLNDSTGAMENRRIPL